ncbi:MAG: hypothetical protein ABIF10_03045, partial [Candidatus Woesearchaeota archaeon]
MEELEIPVYNGPAKPLEKGFFKSIIEKFKKKEDKRVEPAQSTTAVEKSLSQINKEIERINSEISKI